MVYYLVYGGDYDKPKQEICYNLLHELEKIGLNDEVKVFDRDA